MTRNHLIPTPTVDKNGKPTTVYRKQSHTVTAANFPGPILAPAGASKQDDVDSVAFLLQETQVRLRLRTSDRNVDVIRGMSASDDKEYSKRVRETVETLMPVIKLSSSFNAVVDVITEGDENTLKTVHAHRKYLAGNCKAIGSFIALKGVLTDSMGLIPEPDGTMPTIEAHMYAQQNYEKLWLDRGGRRDGASYYQGSPAVMELVEKHPEHVPLIIEYIARGQKQNAVDGFEEYLEQGSMRDGVL